MCNFFNWFGRNGSCGCGCNGTWNNGGCNTGSSNGTYSIPVSGRAIVRTGGNSCCGNQITFVLRGNVNGTTDGTTIGTTNGNGNGYGYGSCGCHFATGNGLTATTYPSFRNYGYDD